ncbi:hypothetical protein PG991_009914 [Apiospora marii]|uniref:AT DNA binding protein n=2 Tax=Apiospora marii TaxID=335849 RepID=A0ABR1RGY9_9PEZI
MPDADTEIAPVVSDLLSSDPFGDDPSDKTRDHPEPSPSKDDQGTASENPEVYQNPFVDLANQVKNIVGQPQEAPEMAPPPSAPAKRGRGRPRKYPLATPKVGDSAKGTPSTINHDDSLSQDAPPTKKRRGRPPKNSRTQSPPNIATPSRITRSGSMLSDSRPFSAGRRDLRVPSSAGVDSEEDNKSPNSTFTPINGRRQRHVSFDDQSADGDLFGPNLKSKLRQALFEDALEHDGGVSIPKDLAEELHQHLGAGLSAPQGELFIRADLVRDLRELFD